MEFLDCGAQKGDGTLVKVPSDLIARGKGNTGGRTKGYEGRRRGFLSSHGIYQIGRKKGGVGRPKGRGGQSERQERGERGAS